MKCRPSALQINRPILFRGWGLAHLDSADGFVGLTYPIAALHPGCRVGGGRLSPPSHASPPTSNQRGDQTEIATGGQAPPDCSRKGGLRHRLGAASFGNAVMLCQLTRYREYVVKVLNLGGIVLRGSQKRTTDTDLVLQKSFRLLAFLCLCGSHKAIQRDAL